ncbi:MAG: NUDIX domain-containing protein [Clostridia bacterium]|nr:NUDIX domain-containing protein [Clostridia bacterium]
MSLLYRVGVKGVIVRDGRFLLVKRPPGDDYPGWALPGGSLEPGETAESCLRREIEEETGLRVMLVGLASTWRSADDRWFGVTYACRYVGGRVRLSDEHSDWRWVRLSDVVDGRLAEEPVYLYPGEVEAALALVRAVAGGCQGQGGTAGSTDG